MPDIVVLVHTISPLISLFDELSAEVLPGVLVKHILDEPLLEAIHRRGGLVAADSARLLDHIKMAEVISSRVVLVTCSTVSPLIDNLRPLTALSIVSINDAMVTAVIQVASRIGILATGELELNSMQEMLDKESHKEGKSISVEPQVVAGAAAALSGGDMKMYEDLIHKAILDISPRVEAIALAQASMARILDSIPGEGRRVPVFTSPRMALEQVRSELGKLGWGRVS